MTVSTEKFIHSLRDFLRENFESQLKEKNPRFIVGMLLNALTPQTIGLLADFFPGLKMLSPLAMAAGVVKDGSVDVDRLEEILEGGFKMAGNEFPLSFRLPEFLDANKTEIGMIFTPRVWEMFKRRLSS